MSAKDCPPAWGLVARSVCWLLVSTVGVASCQQKRMQTRRRRRPREMEARSPDLLGSGPVLGERTRNACARRKAPPPGLDMPTAFGSSISLRRKLWSSNTRVGTGRLAPQGPIRWPHSESQFGWRPRHPASSQGVAPRPRVQPTTPLCALLRTSVRPIAGHIAAVTLANVVCQRISDRFTVLLVSEIDIAPKTVSNVRQHISIGFVGRKDRAT